jgi:hypothetical protein
MQFEGSNPITNTDRNLESRDSENSRNLFLQINFADLPAPQAGKDAGLQLPTLMLVDGAVLDDNVKVIGNGKPAGLSERPSSERTNFDSSEKESDGQRYIPGPNQHSEEKTWNYSLRPSFEPKTPGV